MAELNKLIEMLSSPNADKRYDACEELRIASESSEAAVLALEKAAQDSDSYVAERAEAALKADVHRMMLRQLGRPGGITDEELAPIAQPVATPGPPIMTEREKLIDFAVGSIGWFVIMSVIWLILLSQNEGIVLIALIFGMPVLFLANIILLIVLAFTRKWVALGMLSILTANLIIGLILQMWFPTVCAVPFIVGYYSGF